MALFLAICELWEFFPLTLLGGSFPSLGSFPHMHALISAQYCAALLSGYSDLQAIVSLVSLVSQLCLLILGRPLSVCLSSPSRHCDLKTFSRQYTGAVVGLTVCFSSLKDHYPVLPDAQNLRYHSFIYLSSFCCSGWKGKSVSCFILFGEKNLSFWV